MRNKILITGLCLGLLSACMARADIRYKDSDGDYVQVTHLPCSEQVKAVIQPPEWRDQYYAAFARLGEDHGRACAALVGHTKYPGIPLVHVLFESGESWFIRYDHFVEMEKRPTT